MSHKKRKQHFVPQFLLRYFASDDEKKRIHMLNRASEKKVFDVPIKNQAQASYFYGVDPTFEDFLADMERRASVVIKEIIESNRIPSIQDDRKSYAQLLRFIMFSEFRSKATAEKTEEAMNQGLKTIAPLDPELKNIDFEKLRLTHPEIGALNMAYNFDNWPVIADLKPVLLVNKTKRPFFISDNPFISTNPFMLSRKQYWNAKGLINKGIIILFPLSPEKYILLYDPWAYNVRATQGKIDISRPNDIYGINLLQSIGAERILLFNNRDDIDYVKGMNKSGIAQKKDEHINDLIPHPYKPDSQLMFSYHLEHKTNVNLSFLWQTEAARSYVIHGIQSHPRNQEIVQWLEDHSKRPQDP